MLFRLYLSTQPLFSRDYETSQYLLVLLLSADVAEFSFLAVYVVFRLFLAARAQGQYSYFSQNKVLALTYQPRLS